MFDINISIFLRHLFFVSYKYEYIYETFFLLSYKYKYISLNPISWDAARSWWLITVKWKRRSIYNSWLRPDRTKSCVRPAIGKKGPRNVMAAILEKGTMVQVKWILMPLFNQNNNHFCFLLFTDNWLNSDHKISLPPDNHVCLGFLYSTSCYLHKIIWFLNMGWKMLFFSSVWK